MATVLEDVLPKRSIPLCVYCGVKDSMPRIFIKKIPVYGGKCFSCRTVHNWDGKFSQVRSKTADDETDVEIG
jgi:hypothetical protein